MDLFGLILYLLALAWGLSFVGHSLVDLYFYYLKARKRYLKENREEVDDEEDTVH